MIRWSVTAVLALAFVAGPLGAQEFVTEKSRVRVATIAEGLENPWGLAFLPDGRMLVTERPGRLRLVERSGRLSEPLSGVPAVRARGQGGLLDVAIDPDFASNRFVYLTYAEPAEDGASTAVARGRLADGGLENPTVVFRQAPRLSGNNHWGARLVFARDGSLFVALGDRFERDRAQDPNQLVGKLVRIRPDGSLPPDNPFIGRADARPEIWSIGHRNIQGAALHPATGRIWTIEHGAAGGDEINVPLAGRNYGWPVITYGRDYNGSKIGEGTHKDGLEQPVYYWDPSIAPSGAAFYTAQRFPAWRGNLFVGGLRSAMLVRMELDGEKIVREERLLRELRERIRDVRQGPDGLLYLLTDNNRGRILRLEPVE